MGFGERPFRPNPRRELLSMALKTTPTGVVLPIVALTPIVIIPFARYTEGERPTVRSILGSVIAVAGAAALALSR